MSDFKIGELLEKYYGRSKNVIIPEGIKVIGRGSFEENDYIESVAIPASVIVIEDSAFEKCHNLKKINIAPNSNLKVIGKRAFCFTPIEEFEFPAQLEELHMQAFMGTKLKNIELNDGLREIEGVVFGMCYELKNVFIPKSVYRIDKNAFAANSYAPHEMHYVIYIENSEIFFEWDDDWSDAYIPPPYFLNIKRETFKKILK